MREDQGRPRPRTEFEPTLWEWRDALMVLLGQVRECGHRAWASDSVEDAGRSMHEAFEWLNDAIASERSDWEFLDEELEGLED